MTELAKRAVACRHWRWLPGMLVQTAEGQSWRLDECDEWAGQPPAAAFPEGFPDLTDPATLGCLLALVREAWGCDSLTCQPLLPLVGVHGWRVVGTSAKSGHTEAEALVAALEAAP